MNRAARDRDRIRKIGFGTVVLGLLAIAAPMAAGVSIAVLVGLLVLAAGFARMLWAFEAGSLGRGVLFFAIGLLTLLCGFALVTDPLLASGFLTIIVTIYLLADGLAEIAAAFQVRPASGWGWLLAGGMISVILGLLIWQQFPLSGAWAIGVLLGIKLLFVGLIMVGVGQRQPSPRS